VAAPDSVLDREPHARGLAEFGPSVAMVVPAVAAFFAFFGGGYARSTWVYGLVALGWSAAIAALARSRPRVNRLTMSLVLAATALNAWTLLSALWSAGGVTLAEAEAERTSLYVLAIVALAFAAARAQPYSLLCACFAGALAPTAYALARQLLPPAAPPLPIERFLLARPIGYANALGLFAAIGTLAALELVRAAPHRPVRRVSHASLVVFVAALYLTASRGSWLALAVGLCAAAAASVDRLRFVEEVAGLAPAPVVALALSRLLSSHTSASGSRGIVLFVLLALIAAASAVLGEVRIRWPSPLKSRQLGGMILALGGVAVVWMGATGGLGVGDRATYWKVAWHQFTAHPLLGDGAGSFASAFQRYVERHEPYLGVIPTEAHNVFLETLGELGFVGFTLLTAVLALPLVIAWRARRRPFAVASVAMLAAALVHAFLDWDWELPAVMLLVLSATGVALAADRGCL
jgi:O-antigen ligase